MIEVSDQKRHKSAKDLMVDSIEDTDLCTINKGDQCQLTIVAAKAKYAEPIKVAPINQRNPRLPLKGMYNEIKKRTRHDAAPDAQNPTVAFSNVYEGGINRRVLMSVSANGLYMWN